MASLSFLAGTRPSPTAAAGARRASPAADVPRVATSSPVHTAPDRWVAPSSPAAGGGTNRSPDSFVGTTGARRGSQWLIVPCWVSCCLWSFPPLVAAPAPIPSSSFDPPQVAALSALEMAISPTQVLTPLEMAKLGYEQKIVIPMKVMLKKVMASIKSPSEPIFSCVQLGDSAFMAHVQLDVSTTWYTVGQTATIVTIGGQECASADFAEESAATKAFQYLEKRHCVFVVDYSKKLAERSRDRAYFRCVNFVMHEIEDAVEALHVSITQIGRFNDDVYAKESAQHNGGTSLCW